MTFKKWSTLSTEITWSHYSEILSIKDINIINYYIKITKEQKLSVRELRSKKKNKEYERLDENIKLKLIDNNDVNSINDFIINPIVIKNTYNYEIISEKILKELILDDLDNFFVRTGGWFYIYKK